MYGYARTGNPVMLCMPEQAEFTGLFMVQVMLMVQMAQPPGLRQQKPESKQPLKVSFHCISAAKNRRGINYQVYQDAVNAYPDDNKQCYNIT